jgi:hypothetical protein
MTVLKGQYARPVRERFAQAEPQARDTGQAGASGDDPGCDRARSVDVGEALSCRPWSTWQVIKMMSRAPQRERDDVASPNSLTVAAQVRRFPRGCARYLRHGPGDPLPHRCGGVL